MASTMKYKVFIGVLILVLLVLGQKYKELRRENQLLKDRNVRLGNRVSDYSSALEEANNNIEEANEIIEDAQGYAWSAYEDMGYALDNLQTVDTVSEP